MYQENAWSAILMASDRMVDEEKLPKSDPKDLPFGHNSMERYILSKFANDYNRVDFEIDLTAQKKRKKGQDGQNIPSKNNVSKIKLEEIDLEVILPYPSPRTDLLSTGTLTNLVEKRGKTEYEPVIDNTILLSTC